MSQQQSSTPTSRTTIAGTAFAGTTLAKHYGHSVRITDQPSSEPDDYGFAHRLRVRFAETDAMGIVHHSRYLPYLEEARVEFLRHIGRPYDQIRADGVDFAVLEAHVAYRRPLHFDDQVTVHVAMGTVQRAWFTMQYLLCVDDLVHASATTAHGGVGSDGRPVRLPAWLRGFADGAEST